MKRFSLLLLIVSSCLMNITAQDNVKERVKMSGQVMLSSATNSNFTGGYFSLAPGIRGQATASYRGLAFTAIRNSDLRIPESIANVIVLIPAYTQTFGKFAMTFAAETYLFDQRHDLDLISPGLTMSLKGAVNVELALLYAFITQGPNLFTQRLAISKDFAGYTFKLTGWNVDWGTHRVAGAAEFSTRLTDRVRLTVMGNLNHNIDNDVTQKFGVVRIGYSF
jgi:hypothetical protein